MVPQAIPSEIDYLLRATLGIDAELDFLDDIIASIFTLAPFTPIDAIRSRDLAATYRNLDLGLADAALIATAERLGVSRILTVDERDFRAVRGADGEPFKLLPADAPAGLSATAPMFLHA